MASGRDPDPDVEDNDYWRWLASWQTITGSLAFVVEGYRGQMQPLLMPLGRYVLNEPTRLPELAVALIVK